MPKEQPVADNRVFRFTSAKDILYCVGRQVKRVYRVGFPQSGVLDVDIYFFFFQLWANAFLSEIFRIV